MPGLDRRIVVRRATAGVNQFGEPTVTTADHGLWAEVADLSAFDVQDTGGTFVEAFRKWRIRWRSDLADAPTNEITVLDGGLSYNVTNIVRQEDRAERRRFMIVEGVAVP